MTQQRDGLISVLDLGSMWTRFLVADLNEGALRYRGHGMVPSAGMRKGAIAELLPATQVVSKAAAEAEENAQAGIGSCVIGVGGPHVRGMNSRGGLTLGSRPRDITREDAREAIDRARSVALPNDREMLHQLPQEFLLDDQPGIHDPVGMVGLRLEVILHLSTCSMGAMQSIVTCANKAGLEVTDTIFEALAAAEATLTADERELGVCLVDIGAGTTEVVVFFEGSVVHTAVIPIGGDHFTNDLALGLRLTLQQAERLKCEFGHAVVTAIPMMAEVALEVPEGEPGVVIRTRMMGEILEARARELFHLLRENLREAGVLGAMGSGCVLVGGGATLPGLTEIAESMLRVPARVGHPVRLSRMPKDLIRPDMATVIGMLLYAHRKRVLMAAEDNSLRAKLRAMFAGSI
jgi:cell division protein FtsA